MVGRPGRSGKRLVLATLGVVGALVFAGCDWTMFGYDATNSSSSPDTAINSGNVSTLQPLFTVPAQPAPTTPGYFGSPVVRNGVVYVGSGSASATNGGSLEAFDANGTTNCAGSPNQCSPLWTGPTGPIGLNTAPAVANGVVYVASTGQGSSNPATLYAFDANGVTNCKHAVCQPLWTAPLSAEDSVTSSPIVSNGLVYVTGYQEPSLGQGPIGAVQAFDANGVTNCSGTPNVCQPVWASAADVGYSMPAVANGVLYTSDLAGTLNAFSANGTTNCSGTPTTCSPLWTAPLGSLNLLAAWPVVSGGVVYAAGTTTLNAFDANGVTNCSGTPTTSAPLWTAPGAGLSAVANGIVYGLTASNNDMSAFDANGVTNCTGTPKTCAPLWSYNLAAPTTASVTNGVVFINSGVSSNSGYDLEAFDANGVTSCSGSPKVCQPLWTGLTTNQETGTTAIANGKIYVGEAWNGSNAGHLGAWVLPPPKTSVLIPSNNATISGTQVLAASSGPGVTSLQYEISGGPSNLNNQVVGGQVNPTIYGWLTKWDTTTVPNGTYTLKSVASYGGEVSGSSAPITVTVQN